MWKRWPKIHLCLVLSPLPSSTSARETPWRDAMQRPNVLCRLRGDRQHFRGRQVIQPPTPSHTSVLLQMGCPEFRKGEKNKRVASNLPLCKVTSSKSLLVLHGTAGRCCRWAEFFRFRAQTELVTQQESIVAVWEKT